MKNLIIPFTILIIALAISCKSSKADNQKSEDAIISYSKGRCFGKCPVYDLYIFNDGNVEYKGIENVSKIGTYKETISLEDLDIIKSLLIDANLSTISSKTIRDKPVTTLVFNNEKVTYNASNLHESLVKVNRLIKNIIKKIE